MADEAETVDNSTEEAPSMDDALAAALDGLDKTDTPSEVEASTADPDETVEGETGEEGKETEGEGKEDKEGDEGRERDEHGRFKPKAKEGKEATGGQIAEQQAAAAEQPPAEQLVNGKDIAKPPGSWTPEAATEFAKLPENVRKEIHKREEDFHKGIEQYRGAAQFGTDMAKQFQPYQKMLEATRIAPSDLVHAALQFEYTVRTGTPEQKLQIIHDLAKAYGVNLTGEAEDEGEPADPRFVSLIEKVNGFETKLAEKERQEQEAKQREEQAERERIRSDIAAFASDPKNEFYGQVKDDMLQIIKSGQGADLRDAYDKAIWINPVTREKLIAKQREAERKSAAERAAAAKKANQTNVVPRATPPGKATGKGTLDEALGSAIDTALASSA